jgi:hypothetical protein
MAAGKSQSGMQVEQADTYAAESPAGKAQELCGESSRYLTGVLGNSTGFARRPEMLVQQPRGGFSLKIVTAVLGVLLCADLIARVPFGSLLAGSDPTPTSTTGAALVETSPPAASPTHSAAQPELAAAKEPQSLPSPSVPASAQQPNAAPSPAQQPASQPAETKNTEALPCEQQTWPYIDSRCKDTINETAAPANRQVRVIGNDSSAPATVITPLPAEPIGNTPQGARENNKTDTASAASSTSPLKQTNLDADAAAAPSISTAAIDLPRPAPQIIRQAPALEPVQNTASTPVSSDSAVEESTRKSKRSVRRATQTTSIREEASKTQKRTNKQNLRSGPSDAEETLGRREEAPRGRNVVTRHTAAAESRAYQLPSGRRIIVFRQSNGEVGIAPDTGGSSAYFFGR